MCISDGSNKKLNDTVNSDMGKEILCYEVAKKIENGTPITLLDVRTNEEYKVRHLNSALLVPVEELSEKTLSKVGLGNNMLENEIVVYCRSGIRGAEAYRMMKELGYTNVKNLSGGMLSWEDAGYSLDGEGEYMTSLEEV